MEQERKKPISEIRKEIDDVDEEILKLLNRRAELALEIGRIKRSDAKPYYTPERERQIYERLLRLSRGPLQKSQIQAVFREIISAVRSLEKHLVVCYLGPEGSLSHSAALKQFGDSVECVACTTIEEAFRAVENGKADYAVAPVENSVSGMVPETLDMFPQTNVKICGEVYLPVSHHLLSRSPQKKIKRVYAQPQTIEECRTWLRTHLPHVEIIETASVHRASEHATRERNAGAIGNKFDAERTGLRVVAEHIEDNPHGRTRFLVVGYNEPAPTGNDKTSLMFNLRNRPGELYRALGAFNRHKVNIMVIESRPAKRASFEYIFYVDCAGHHTDEHLSKAIQSLKKYALECVVLGSYPIALDAESP
ncbi:MAG TPA: prephenate dehydratase [Fimbriimonadales bacterium]|nr:prephenate dehydratase [Fimbriimonadales bacterium]